MNVSLYRIKINMMNIIILENNMTFLDTLQYFLRSELKYNISETYDNVDNFLGYRSFDKSDLILINLNMPDITRLFSKAKFSSSKKLKVIAFTDFIDEVDFNNSIINGIHSCIQKVNIYTHLPIAIKKVTDNNYYFPEIDIK